MIFYLTNSVYQFEGQPDPTKSLGGYISSTPVPNKADNFLFGIVSSNTLKRRKKETLGIALRNILKYDVSDVMLYLNDTDVCSYRMAFSVLDEPLMERISSRYHSPFVADWYDQEELIEGVFVTEKLKKDQCVGMWIERSIKKDIEDKIYEVPIISIDWD